MNFASVLAGVTARHKVQLMSYLEDAWFGDIWYVYVI